ncbi:MAG: hypothetical protein EBU90_09150 [Proteobacteria bacterium]|nr:hypothetical protein [Pseudomonadota bacterium]NBP14280.1 hypothetical protein [bacterium]
MDDSTDKYVDKSIYDTLLVKYNELTEKYQKLQHDYSENTIVESMNDMKRKYEQLVANTVPAYKYNLINEKYERLSHTFIGSEILIDHIVKGLKRLETVSAMDRTNLLYKIQLELLILKEILQDSVVARN